jgi:uncharacterized protein
LNRRRFLKQIFAGAAGLVSVAALDALWLEPNAPVVEHVRLRLARLPEAFHEFRVLVMGDFHYGPWVRKGHIEHAVRIGLTLKPHLTIFTGDFVSHPLLKPNGPAGAKNAEPCAQILQQLAVSPVVAILGNHDHWNRPDEVAAALAGRGIPVLRNRAIPIERDGKRIWIVGVDDVYEKANDLSAALDGVPHDETKIVAVHEPDFADEVARHSVDLQVSGHSHGGQVWIPGIGAPILPALAHKYPRGLNKAGNLQVYTNRGIGMVAPPVRLNCRPEITLITLVGQAEPSRV